MPAEAQRAALSSYFEQSAARHLERAALNIEGRSWSYREVRAAKGKVIRFLREQGLAGRGRTVGLLCDKSLAAYAGMLGIMDAGCVYVPLNPKFPPERLSRMLEDAELSALIAGESLASTAAALLRGCARPVLVLLPECERVPECMPATGLHRCFAGGEEDDVQDAPAPMASGGDPAYLLFTSGSTGRPKGVPVTHENARCCVESVSREFAMTESDRFTQFAELTFDFSIGEIFLCWKAGGCLYVPSFAELMMPIRFVLRNELTVWSSVPTLANNLKMLRVLKPDSLRSLRLSFFCGEALSCDLAAAWQAAAPAARVVNLYGPTEAAVFATYYVYDPASPPAGEVVPIGAPLSGFSYRILREDGSPAPAGAPGELLLAGPQVVPGYWRDPAGTARSFMRLPDDPEGRVWYRTGDLASFDDEVGLRFRGRRDHQVKLRGFRVELQEIEAVLKRVAGCDAAAVVPLRLKNGRCEDVVGFCSEAGWREDEIKRRCKEYLPDYMVPQRIFPLGELPVNENGKVNYLKLSALAEDLIHNAAKQPEAGAL